MEKILFSPPDISEEEIAEVVDTLKSGWITTGPKTKLFESKIAEKCNTNKAVCLNSATACMELVLRMLGVKEGDEVITSAYTYTATCSVICHVGATPVLVDTGKDSYEIDYDAVEEAITEKTKVIMPVDIAGVMCDYDKLYKIVERKKDLFNPSSDIQKKFGRIIILADAAHSFGAKRNNKMSGEAADFTSFSFHAVKNLTTAEGGALTWKAHEAVDDEELYKLFMLMSLHGQSKDALAKTQAGAWEYDIVEPYYKCNMTDIMASIGLVQLKRYDAMLARRKEMLQMYVDGLDKDKISVIKHYFKDVTGESVSNGHLCLIRVKGADREKCNEIITKMAEKDISLNVHFKPLPLLSAYKKRGFCIDNYPNAYNMYANTITLPLHTKLTDEQIKYIIESLNGIVNE